MHKGKYEITAAQKQEIEEARRKNKDKRIEAKLKALSMRADGMKSKAISEATGFHTAYVSTIVSKYIHGGIESITGNHYPVQSGVQSVQSGDGSLIQSGDGSLIEPQTRINRRTVP